MALVNPPSLYTAGAVKFDATPSVRLYGDILLKRKAKQDALDEYDRQRINHVNAAGVRDADREGLDNRVMDIQVYFNQNKDKIRQGNTPEYYEYEKKFRDVGGYINQSKERTAKQDAAMKFYNERLKQDQVIPDDFVSELHANDLPIDFKPQIDQTTGKEIGSKSFDLTKWLSSPKPFDQQKFVKGFADLKRVPGMPKYTSIEGQPLLMTETIDETFDTGGKQAIAARAADKYENSYSFREQVKNEIKDPVRRKKLEDIFVAQYGTQPLQPEDYATAYSMELLQPTVSKSKQVPNKSAIMAQQQQYAKERLAISNQNSIRRLYTAYGLNQQTDQNIENAINNLIAGHISTAGQNKGEVLTDNETFKAITGKDKTSSSVLTIDDQGNYQYGVKNDDGTIEVKGQIPYSLGKAKLVDTYRGGFNKRINPNTQKAPKPSKATTPSNKTSKPSWAN